MERYDDESCNEERWPRIVIVMIITHTGPAHAWRLTDCCTILLNNSAQLKMNHHHHHRHL